MPRDRLIDALRGLALGGIALPNLLYFTWPATVGSSVFFALGETLADRIALFAVTMLAMNKFYPIFAFLFGVGAGLMARQWGRDFGRRYRRRLAFLLVAGLLHGTLLWFGDILALYAMCGFILLAYADRRPGRVLGALRTWVAVTLVFMAAGAAATLVGLPPGNAAMQGTEVAQQLAAERDEAFRVHGILATGTYLQATAVRVEAFVSMATGALFGLFTEVVSLFLAGVMVARLGWFRARPANDARWRRIARWGLGLGLPLNALLAFAMVRMPAFAEAFSSLLYLAGPLLSAGYVAGFVLAWRRGPGWLVALSPAGRMAFSNYLLQSLVFALVLSGFGLGMAQHWGFAALLAFGLAFFVAVQLPLSAWWLSRHPQGPLEALWRRFTYA